jgi:O-antigen ligase
MTLGGSLKKVAQLAVCFVGPYLFAAQAGRERRALRFAVTAFLGLATLEAAYAVLFQFVPGQLGTSGLWPPYLAVRAGARAMGTVDASFGHFMAAALVLALAVAAQGEGRLRRLGSVAAPVLLAGLISSGTRGSAIAAGVGGLVVIALSPRRRAAAVALAGLGALVGLAAVACPQVASPSRIGALFTGHGASVFAVRMLSWRLGWELGVAHPWLGVGPGANALAVEGLLGIPAEALRHVEGAMNAYLQAFLETGVIGLAGMIAFILGVSRQALMRGARGSGLALGLGAAVLALGVTGMTGPLLMGGIGHLLFVLAGLAVAAAKDGDG